MERGNMSDMNERGPHDFSFVLLFNNLHCNKGFLLKTFSSMLSLDCDGADDSNEFIIKLEDPNVGC